MPYLAGFITPQDFGATGGGVIDDTAALNDALSYVFTTYGGGYVFVPWGEYLVSAPIVIPPYTFLVGETALTLNLNTTPTSVAQIVASSGWAPASSSGIVEILSKTPGGWSENTSSCGLRGIYINGVNNTSTNLNGINMVGPCYDVHLEDVFINTPGHNGISSSGQSESGITPTFPYHQRYDRVTIAYAANNGFSLTNFTDSTYVNCLAFQNAAAGWVVNNCSNNVWTSCRAEWNEYGFSVSGSSGSLTFTGCTTDQNSREGLYINTATGQTTQGGGVIWTGGKLHADANGSVSGHSSGILVTGSTVPVVISGANVEAGENVSTFFPPDAITLTSSSNITVAGCTLQGVTSAWNDTGGNTKLTRTGCVGFTGDPNTQTVTVLPNITSGGEVIGATAPLGDNGVGTLQLANAGTVPSTNPTGGLVAYSTGGQLAARNPQGLAQTLSSVIAAQTSTNTVTGVTAETVLQTVTIPANDPAAGAVYHLTGYGTYSSATGDLGWELRWGGTGGTTIASLPTTNVVPAASGSFWYDATLTFRSTTSVTAAINLEMNSSTTTGVSTSYVSALGPTAVTTTSSTALTVDVTPSSSADSILLIGGCVRRLA